MSTNDVSNNASPPTTTALGPG